MQVSLSTLALRLSEQQLRDNLRLMEYVHRLHARLSCDAGAHSSVETFIRPIRAASGSARLAWQLALQRCGSSVDDAGPASTALRYSALRCGSSL